MNYIHGIHNQYLLFKRRIFPHQFLQTVIFVVISGNCWRLNSFGFLYEKHDGEKHVKFKYHDSPLMKYSYLFTIY